MFKGNKSEKTYEPPRLQNKTTRGGFENVCFGNAAIQALLSIKKFRTFLLENSTKRHNCPIQERIIRYLCTLITTNDEKTIDTFQFIGSLFLPDYTPLSQHDSFLFMLHILQTIHDSTDNQFKIKKNTYILCLNDQCNHSLDYKEDSNTISLDLQNFSESVQELLNNYNHSEQLYGYTCDNCRRSNTTMKYTTIDSTSDVLIVHLKIYQYDWRGSCKIVPKISIDDVVIISGVSYYLKSIIYHAGPSVEAGHYFALIRINNKDEWIVCNDTDIHQHSYGPFKCNDYPDPYVLVYEKIEISETGETSPSVSLTKRKKTDDIESGHTSSSSSIEPGKSNLINELKYQASKVKEGLSHRKNLIENFSSKRKKSAISNTERQKKYRENLTQEKKMQEQQEAKIRMESIRANYTPEKKKRKKSRKLK